MQLRKLFFVFFFLYLSTPFVSAADMEYEFRLMVKEGESYRYRIDTEQEISQIINKTWITISAFYSMDIELAVEKVNPDGEAAVKFEFKRIKQSQKRGKDLLFEFDTAENSEIPESQKAISALIGESFMIRFDQYAKIIDITGVDRILQNTEKKLTEEIKDLNMRDQMLQGIKKMFNQDSLKDMLLNVNFFPQKRIKVGSSWNIETKNKSNFPITVNSAFTLNFLDEKRGLISMVSEIRTDEGGSRFSLGNLQLNYDLKGSQKGEIHFDSANSLSMNMQMRQSMFGKVFIEGNSAIAPWPISIVSTVSFKILK